MSYNSLEEIVRECQEKDLPFDEVILLEDLLFLLLYSSFLFADLLIFLGKLTFIALLHGSSISKFLCYAFCRFSEAIFLVKPAHKLTDKLFI